jgi:hypothetical protein
MDVCMTHRSPSPYRTPETTTLGEGRGFPVTRGFGLVLRLSSRLSSRLSWLRGVFVWAIAGPLSVPRSVFRVPCSVFRVPAVPPWGGVVLWLVMATTSHRRWDSVVLYTYLLRYRRASLVVST